VNSNLKRGWMQINSGDGYPSFKMKSKIKMISLFNQPLPKSNKKSKRLEECFLISNLNCNMNSLYQSTHNNLFQFKDMTKYLHKAISNILWLTNQLYNTIIHQINHIANKSILTILNLITNLFLILKSNLYKALMVR